MKLFLLSFLLLFGSPLFGQTTLSGVVNQYFAVNAINPATATLTLNNTTGINVGDTLLIIQMKGASIDQSNTSSYGNVDNYNGAGSYELVEVCETQGTNVILKKHLVNSYNENGGVQLVKFPSESSILVNGFLSADPWDGSKGGIVVLRAASSIELNANIDVTGDGFKGGAYSDADASPSYWCNSFIQFPNYEYPVSSGRGATKGEGIANFTSNNGGKGPLANGGGGGNDHNTGGGGGSNLTNGGGGGINTSNSGCAGDHPGLGGVVLSDGGNRLFLGGGGGAGHANGPIDNPAGDGGGIIFLIADEIIGNNQYLIAHGRDGNRGWGDGGSGGGAGGSIFLDVNSYTGTLNVHSNGGNGGNGNGAWYEDDGVTIHDAPAQNCFGPGGGGSGGAIYLKQSTQPSGLNIAYSGGQNGIINNTENTGCDGESNGATAGSNGTTVFNNTVPIGNKVNKSCSTNPQMDLGADTTLCNGNSLTLDAQLLGSYSWSTGASTQTITVNASGLYWVTVDLGDCIICDTIMVNYSTLSVDLGGDQALCAGQSIVLDAGPGGSSYTWSTSESSASISVNTSGVYSVSVSDGLCTSTDQVVITSYNWPQEVGDSAVLCDYQGVELSAENPGATYTWSTGASSQSITANEPGTYSVTIGYGGLTCAITEDIEVIACENELFVPNTFTPNGDGDNDTWVIRGLVQYPGNSLFVYNRNGALIFESNNYDSSWDGGNYPATTYFYILNLNNGGNPIKGSVSILREQ